MGLQLISCSAGLRIDIRPEKTNYTPKGDVASVDPPLFIQFQRGGNVPDHAKQLVEQLPGFRQGIGRDEDPYLTRLGWWDSVAAQQQLGWSDEDREYVEQRVLAVGDPNVMVLREQEIPAPYANWAKHRKTAGKRTLEHVFADVQAVFDTAGFDVQQAVAHERQNGNDPRVIEFLGSLESEPVESEEAEVVAA